MRTPDTRVERKIAICFTRHEGKSVALPLKMFFVETLGAGLLTTASKGLNAAEAVLGAARLLGTSPGGGAIPVLLGACKLGVGAVSLAANTAKQ